MSLGNLAISDNWRRWETDPDAAAGSALLPPDQIFVSHHSRWSISSKAVRRQATRKLQSQAEASRTPDFAETTSWQLYRSAQRQLKLIRERPLRVVRDGVGFDHTLRGFWIGNKKRRLREIAKVIDDDFLLLGIIQVKAANDDAIDQFPSGSRGSRHRSGRSCWRRSRRSFPGAFFRRPKQFSTGSCGKLGDPDVCFRQTRV